jgi:hypothetical protein
MPKSRGWCVTHGGEDLFEEARRDGLADLVERDRLAEAHVFGGHALLLEAAVQDVHDFVELERLQDVVVGAALHRVDRGLDGAEAGHDHGDGAGGRLADLFEQGDATHSWHLQVADDEIELFPLQVADRCQAVFGRAHGIPFHAEELREHLANGFLVVDHQDARSTVQTVGHRGLLA